jgi:hypothetical protein
MAKPENPGNGDEAYSVVVVAEGETFRYEGTGHLEVTADGSLLVGKGPLAAFSATAWLRAYVEPLPPAEPRDP